MATASDIANLKNCAIADRKGTGIKHCAFKLGTVRKPVLSIRGFDYGGIADLTQANIAVEIQKGNIIPLPKLFNYIPSNEENAYETSDIGIKSLARKGLYESDLVWGQDDRLQEVISSYDSNDKYDIVLVDTDGNWKLTQNGTEYNGASLGLFDSKPFTNGSGSEAGKVTAMIQFNSPADINKNAVYFAQENLGFNMMKQEGINDITLKMTSFAAAATSVSFTAYLKDGSTLFSAGSDTDFKLTINGTAEDISGDVSYADGVYTIANLSALSATDVIKLSTWDANTSTVAIIKDTTDVYSGKEISVTVA